MRNIFFLILPFLWSCAIAQKQDVQTKYADLITEEATYAHLEKLATEEMEGRGTGQPGIKKAAQYIAQEFEKYGLSAPVEGSYFQEISFIEKKLIADKFEIDHKAFSYGKDFYIQTQNNFSDFNADEIVFVGYGIQDETYNDLQNLDIEGKAVLLINEGEPIAPNGDFLLSGSNTPSEWGRSRFKKIQELLKLNPKIILSYDSRNKSLLDEDREEFHRSQISLAENNTAQVKKATEQAPIIHLSKEAANHILSGANTTLEKVTKEINSTGKPQSQVVKASLTAELGVKEEEFTNPNVLGYLEGSEKKDEVLIITAHYDHEGIINGEIYFGADDNASGTSGILNLAKSFSEAKKAGDGPKRSILFIAFVAEEKGLLGSKYYVENPVIPLQKSIVNINMDMIGRIDDLHLDKSPNYIHTIGAKRSSGELYEINETANKKYTQLDIDYTYDKDEEPLQLFKRSDQYSFYQKNIPIIFYFSGLHPHYHTPEDTIDKIDFPMTVKRTKLVFHTAWEIANRDKKLENNLLK